MKSIGEHFSSRVLRAKDAAAFLSLGESTFWRWARDGRRPKGTRLSARATVWKIADLDAFLEQQAANQGGVNHE
jgi:predicted DNA-binding transcriptional regulator AlpA